MNRSYVNNRLGNSERTLNVTLMMLILAFFIVLTAMSVPSDDNRKAALGSLSGAIGILPGGTYPGISKGRDLTIKSGVILDQRMNLAVLLSKFEDYVRENKKATFIRTIVTKGGLEVIIQNSLMFKPGRASFKPETDSFLKSLAFMLKRISGPLRVESYTSSQKITTTRYQDNIELSIARAGTLVRYLIGPGEIRKNRISLAGFGELRPLYPEDSAENRQKNSRTRIFFQLK